MNNEIFEYVKKRDEVLNKFDIYEFKKWILYTNPQLIKKVYFFNSTSKAKTILLAAMCKCCIASTGVTEEVKEKARKELDKLGMDWSKEKWLDSEVDE